MHILFKLATGFIVDMVWAVALEETGRAALTDYWLWVIPPVISLFPGGYIINLLLIAAGALHIHDPGIFYSLGLDRFF